MLWNDEYITILSVCWPFGTSFMILKMQCSVQASTENSFSTFMHTTHITLTKKRLAACVDYIANPDIARESEMRDTPIAHE